MKKDQINILIVDDDFSSRQSLEEVITRAGYKTTVVDKAEGALNAVRIKPTHGAIIDCMLPKMNGVALAEELRKSRFGDGPIVFVSGIFKDKAFAQDAMVKTGAIEFLTKPIQNSTLVELFDGVLASQIDAPKIPLHALLSKPYASDRERLKALETIEEVSGLDLPLIIAILLDSQSSGYLNVVTSSGDISGITIQKGMIAKVDTAEGGSTTGNLLVKAGLLTSTDMDELSDSSKKGDLIKNLINENLISPHASQIVRNEQIFSDLEKMIKEPHLQINFAPERVKKAGEGVSSSQLTSFYHRVIAKYFSLKWFESFYRDWLDHPMRQGAEFSTSHEAFSLFKDDLGQEFTEIFSQEKTIDELISNKKWDTLALYRAIHLSALRRVIMFDDVKKTKTTEDDKGRLEVILKDIEGKDPFQIFRYFGASEELHPRDVEKIYKEFARANHPDTFSSSGSKEIKVLVHKVYSIVSDAYDILTNQSKREKFVNSIRAKDAQNQMVSERLMEEGLVLLRRGQFKGALAKFEEAVEFFSSTMLDLYWCWASIKSLGDSKSDEELAGIFKRLDKIPVENRRSAHYLYVSGLLKKAQGDLKGALSQFERSLTIDSNFLDVRRDISILRQEMGGSGEGLTGELTAIVGRLFKKQGKK